MVTVGAESVGGVLAFQPGTVTVSGLVRGPIPGLRPTVTASAGGPVERFVPESER